MYAIPTDASCPRMKRHVIVLLLLLYFCGDLAWQPKFALAQDQQSSSSYAQLGFTTIDRVQDVVSAWTPDRRLYVKGDIGASRQQLADLEAGVGRPDA